MTREEAWELLTEYNQDEFHLLHAQTVENTMRYFARELGFADEEDFWGIVGLLHDLDVEKYPEEHCIKSQEIMKERGIDEKIIHATASHGYAWMDTGNTRARISQQDVPEKSSNAERICLDGHWKI